MFTDYQNFDFQIFIKPFQNTRVIDINKHSTVKSIKFHIEKTDGIPIKFQNLYCGRVLLDNNKELSHYDIKKETTLRFTLRMNGDYQNT